MQEDNDIPFFEIYKFTYKRYCDGLTSGKSVRVGTISDYRGKDSPGSEYFKQATVKPFTIDTSRHLEPKGGIDDPYEGRTVVYVDKLQSWVPEDLLSAKITAAMTGIDPLFGGYGTSRNNIITIQVPNYYIFCTSSSISPETIQRMKRDSSKFSKDKEPYDVAVPITDPLKLVELIRAAICKFKGIKDPISVRTISAPVQYENQIYEAGSINTKPPSPFVKHKFFKSQSEYRMLIEHPLPREEKSINIDLEVDVSRIFGEPIYI